MIALPEILFHVRSAITGARVVANLTEDVARAECDRLNREAETGERASYDDGHGGQIPAQRLISIDTGRALADDPDDPFPPEHVGRILHAGRPMLHEIEREERRTPEEWEEERKRLEAERTARA